MTTLVLKLTPLEAGRLEFAASCVKLSREEAAKEAIRLFLRSMPTEPPKTKLAKLRKR